MRILALDLGKNKSVYSLYNTTDMTRRFGTSFTTPQALHDLLVEQTPDRVVIEVGPSSGWFADLCRALELDLQVANVNHEAWRWRRLKKKTDRVDAQKLAELSSMNQLPLVHIPQLQTRQWRSLIEFRHDLVVRRTAVKNHIHALFDTQGIKIPGGKKGWSLKAQKQLATHAKPLTDCAAQELWRGQLHLELANLTSLEKQLQILEDRLEQLAQADKRVALLRTCPGVGPRIAEAAVAIVDDPHRFKNAKQVGAYAGLTPRRFQSGQTDRSGHISKQGNPLLRTLLVEGSWIGLRYNPALKAFYQKVKRNSPKRAKIAIVASARWLLVRLWAMLRDNQPWRAPQPDSPQQPIPNTKQNPREVKKKQVA